MSGEHQPNFIEAAQMSKGALVDLVLLRETQLHGVERECVQLRAEVARLREIRHGDPHMLGAVLGYELREAEEAGEVVQLRAERDQALTLLRAVLADCDADERSSVNLAVIRERITTHLDGEGQQR